jgi:hypothetical protein
MVVSYAPTVFCALRHYFGVSDSAFDMAVGFASGVLNGGPSQGKSKSFFFFSGRDFVIKTLLKHEHKFLKSILAAYLDHVRRLLLYFLSSVVTGLSTGC